MIVYNLSYSAIKIFYMTISGSMDAAPLVFHSKTKLCSTPLKRKNYKKQPLSTHASICVLLLKLVADKKFPFDLSLLSIDIKVKWLVKSAVLWAALFTNIKWPLLKKIGGADGSSFLIVTIDWALKYLFYLLSISPSTLSYSNWYQY